MRNETPFILEDENGRPYPFEIQELIKQAAHVVARKHPNTTYTLSGEIDRLQLCLERLGYYA